MDDLQEIIGEFLIESNELLDQFEGDLVALEIIHRSCWRASSAQFIPSRAAEARSVLAGWRHWPTPEKMC